MKIKEKTTGQRMIIMKREQLPDGFGHLQVLINDNGTLTANGNYNGKVFSVKNIDHNRLKAAYCLVNELDENEFLNHETSEETTLKAIVKIIHDDINRTKDGN